MSACTHFSKIRLLGSDPRLYQCTTADNYVPPADGRWWGKDRPRCWGDGCGAFFVEGQTWNGEPRWIPVLQPVACDYCLDGLMINETCRECSREPERFEKGPGWQLKAAGS